MTTANPEAVAAEKLRRKLSRKMLRTVTGYGLINPGDKIMVAVSGGKDSYTLLDLLWQAKQRSPVPFDLVAVHLDQVQPGYDGRPLAEWLEAYGAPYELLRKDTYSVVKSVTPEGGTYCAPCSRFRRGILYEAAERLGCNKIALGHHRDDSLQTFLMNLFYSGKLQAMPASYTTDDGRFDVIRPLIECAERDIAQHALNVGYPILPCNLCGSQSGLKRQSIEALLTRLEGEIPDVRTVMLAALQNVRPSHLLDTKVAEAWAAFAEGETPAEAADEGCGGAPAPRNPDLALPVIN
ncbi:MAG: tRNA 2-thiocytidine(32) synthetase TtcA [Bradymonadia bacterium]